MSQVYLIADTHFGGDEIIRYENRPFATVDEMTQCFIANWNETVTDEDTIYVLGDFSTNQTEEEDQAILKELRGNKILIMGNLPSLMKVVWNKFIVIKQNICYRII